MSRIFREKILSPPGRSGSAVILSAASTGFVYRGRKLNSHRLPTPLRSDCFNPLCARPGHSRRRRGPPNAVKDRLADQKTKSPLIAATKPQGKHSGIAYLLTESGEKIEFDPMSPAHNLIMVLRDVRTYLANRVHRELRDSSHNYELAAVLPSFNEAERRDILRAVGSIGKLTVLADADMSQCIPGCNRPSKYDLRPQIISYRSCPARSAAYCSYPIQ